MTRGICVCGRVGYAKCTVHGDPVKGVGVTDGEFKELIVRNKGAILEVFTVNNMVALLKEGRTYPITVEDRAKADKIWDEGNKKVGRLRGKAVGR